ncbi:TrmH family RNA methyltransferase [Nesterenkonia sp. F]|uniref:TrmH family RNA methyltransferase n=1 Tax=Nesterenkonia sp. F TaxID=795955 RepID=UPI00350FA0DC
MAAALGGRRRRRPAAAAGRAVLHRRGARGHPDVQALLDRARGLLFDPQDPVPRASKFFLREATAEVLATMGDAETSQGLVAVGRIPRGNDVGGLESVLAGWSSSGPVRRPDGSSAVVQQDHEPARLAAGLLGLKDPGNVGTIIRTADAAGAGVGVLGPGTTDPWAPKVVRAAAGSHFHLPLFVGIDPGDLVTFVRAQGTRVLAADGAGELALTDVERPGEPALWLFGHEAHGLSEGQKALADARVSIPLYGRAESLNVATAATVCLYSTAMAQHAGAPHAGEGGGGADR